MTFETFARWTWLTSAISNGWCSLLALLKPHRMIYEANVSIVSGEDAGDDTICMLQIRSVEHLTHTPHAFSVRGIAFLWHMVRCIMAVLFLVGEGKEKPEVVSRSVVYAA